MTDGSTDRPTGRATDPDPADDRARRAAERARIDRVFGETLPETTSDETRGGEGRLGDEWWRDQRPPHHG